MSVPPTDPRSATAALEPIARDSVVDQVARRLTSYILDAGLKPGDKMPSERQLMDQLAVGRSSLREAVKTLAALGVVRVSVGEGMFVGDGSTSLLTRPMSWGLLIGEHGTREVVEARRAVEVELAGLAALRATGEDVAELRRRLAAMKAGLADPETYTMRDQEFHQEVWRIARNRILQHVLETLRHIVRAWIYQTFTGAGDTGQSYDEHVAIADAIGAKDVEAARRAMGEHMDAARSRLIEVLGLELDGEEA